MGNLAEIYGEEFDTGSVEPAGDFSPVPAGWYDVGIDSAGIRDTKAGNGKYLHLELIVIQDEYNGRKFFPNINLQNPNAKAVEIGMRELASLGLACEMAKIGDTDELIGKMLKVRVKIKEDQNEVTAYKPINADVKTAKEPVKASAPAATPASAPATTSAPAANKRPWEK